MSEPAVASWLLALLRCPYCMSELAPTSADAVLQCRVCQREYPLYSPGAGLSPIPRLRRDDPLATLAQDIVVYHDDPDSTRADRRKLIAHFERRERFLAPLLHDIARPYAILAARPDWTPHAPDATEIAAFDRFAGLLPPGGTVLDLACGAGQWSARLGDRGFRVVAADSSPHPPTPSPYPWERGRKTAPRLPSTASGRGPASHGVGGEGVIAFVEAHMMEMPFASATLDGVWCSEAFEYVRPDRRAVFFRQVHRVLRPGGVLYLSAETASLSKIVRQYLLWRVAFRQPVHVWEYIYRLPHAHSGGWHYHVMTSAHTLHDACRDHGLAVLALRRAGGLWLLLARKKG